MANKVFDLNNPKQRKSYFELKIGDELSKLKDYFRKGNTFIAYLLGKKNAGKGTYTKLFIEALGSAGKNIAHISVGDVVRELHSSMQSKARKKELLKFLQSHYRGYLSPEKAVKALLSRDTKTLLPSEFIMALVKREIDMIGKKSIFIDGFPRNLDQISYSLYFRDLIAYRPDRDLFILIDVPEQVINERMKYRVICPKCHTSRNLKLFPTSRIGFDKKTSEFYLMCDNPECNHIRMVAKEGDELGIENIRDRLEMDGKLIQRALELYGVPKIFLNNSIPKKDVNKYAENYELTPEYIFQWDKKENKVITLEKPWIIKDDNGNLAHSFLAAPVVVSMVKQLVDVLGL